MTRTTLMLPEELKVRAIRQARTLGISFGEFVRQALAQSLAQVRAARTDCLLSDSAVFEGPCPVDLSSEHDRHLYGEES